MHSVARSYRALKAIAAMAFVTAAVFSLTAPMLAQTANGRILGSVRDQSGGTIAGAKVVVTDVARGTTRTLTTDDSGAFLAANLTASTYTVHAEFQGFQA